ncbi:hypothetical protein PFF91_37460 [Burkholderia cenocepacia]|uniref:hypothetical protein n=1 Tax=Burkholderia cenocepacia TaxID=95486 RepID=UPI0022EAE695|nr:hypothetical protein [Burkholderia cenocepacia]MDA3672379.1 hypothetical protein [Burkholderia cenocepacia]MDA3681929.1 hypothetical protein [Burkholderia cenocepacia]MDA3689226.1 hypothetical protein [Burkholderia cenocepacia]MDA3696701.1 hypothetical protein [Burkholderia cenocepacia]MDA3704043.1 hypothetical protein [Burkholderia cenocepacia]
MKETTTVNLRGTYFWPIDEVPAKQIQWTGIDLSDVLDGPLPGLCAYYGHSARHAVSVDHQRVFQNGGSGRAKGERPTRAIATLELDVALTNPVPGSTNPIDRWKRVDTPVLDLRQDRYPRDLLPLLEAKYGAKRRRGVCAALSASPTRARELLVDLPHLEAVVMPLHCKDDTHRIVMWVVDPAKTVTRIASPLSGIMFSLPTRQDL